MGIGSWIRKHLRGASAENGRAPLASAPAASPVHEAPREPAVRPVAVAPYLPVDPAEHRLACVIACACAAADHPSHAFTLRSLARENPEYRRVAVIATACAAATHPTRSWRVTAIYRLTPEEGHHAA